MYAADFRSTYRGTVLGIFWNFTLPLVPISVYILLVNLKVFPRFEGLDPSVYISFNVTYWMLLIGMVNRPINVVQQRTQQSMKTAIPLSAEITASFAQLCFETLVRAALVTILVIAYGPVPETNIPPLFFTFLVGLFFGLSIGLLLSIFNMVYPDVNRLTGIFFQYAIFLSGVIFPVSTLGPLAVLENINPFNVFIKSSRDFFFFGAHADMQPLYIWAAVALVLTLIAGRFFYVMEIRVREVV